MKFSTLADTEEGRRQRAKERHAESERLRRELDIPASKRAAGDRPRARSVGTVLVNLNPNGWGDD